MSGAWEVRVDPIECAGHLLCVELLPERLRVDDWGYPMVDGRPVSGELLAHARRAAAACPTLALRLNRRETGKEAERG
ncbi:MAG: ferredoxin [Streptosporangiales bacterium]|nr:ferredoxin [Streptosporangiales bacterium]MBO0889565.1 ferredoxin [Acidothermales bacterium]